MTHYSRPRVAAKIPLFYRPLEEMSLVEMEDEAKALRALRRRHSFETLVAVTLRADIRLQEAVLIISQVHEGLSREGSRA